MPSHALMQRLINLIAETKRTQAYLDQLRNEARIIINTDVEVDNEEA